MRIHVALLLLVLAFESFAQVNKSNLVGVVRDSSGAAVPGVTIKITNTGTGAVRREVTEDTGLYRANLLDVGTYTLEAEKAGFKKVVKSGILLPVGETITLDFSLEVGGLTDTITVSAASDQLRTETGSVGSTLESRNVQQLPSIGRNPYVFVSLVSGIQYTGDPTYVNPWDASGPSAFVANGFGSGTGATSGANSTSMFYLDGVVNLRMDAVSFSPSPDAVQEMRAQTNAFDAEYGHSGAAFINVTTRGGTNNFHGTVYDYLRNNFLNANDFFSNRSGLGKAEFHQDDYGGSLGGPLSLPKIYKGRDRTFFFFNYEGTQLRQGGNTPNIVPTALQRSGDFSQTVNTKGQAFTIYDPNSSTTARTPFPGNVIPTSRLDPVALKLINFYPLPNLVPSPGTLQNFVGNGVSSGVSTRGWNSLITRVDQRINDSQSLFFRYGWNHRTDTTIPYYGIPGADTELGDADGFFRGNHNGAVGYTWTVNARTVLDIRTSIVRYGEGNVENTLGMDLTTLGFPASFAKSTPYPLFPTITMKDGDVYNLGGGNTPSKLYINELSPQISVHSIYGRHALKYGFNFIGVQYNNFSPAHSGGTFTFDRSFTQGPNPTVTGALSGFDWASFMLGTPGSGSVDFNAVPAYEVKYFGFFAQDDFKVSDRLSLNVGIRFSHEGPITERYDRANSGFDPNATSPIAAAAQAAYAANPVPQLAQLPVKGGLGFLGVGGAPSGYLSVPTLYEEPRFGFAYRISSRIVWRAGYGIFIAPNNQGGIQNTGFSLSTAMITSLNNNVTPYNTLSNPFPTGVAVPPGASGGLLTGFGTSVTGGLAAIGSVPAFKDAMNQQFSTGFQFVLPGQISLETSYVGNNVQHLTTANRPIDSYPVADLALGSALNNTVPNPFYNLIPGNTTATFSKSTIALSQLLTPFPQFTGVSQSSLALGRSHYNSLQLMANKRFAQGLTLSMAYTFSKYMQNVAYHNIDDAAPESVISGSDRPSDFVVSGMYELPFGRGKRFLQSANPVVDRVVGGWQLSWTGTYTSGQALSFGTPASATALATGAERIGTSNDNPHTVLHWFDITQFAPLAPFTLQHTSTALANLRGPGIGMWHVDLAKDIPITERVKFRLEAQAFNFLNTPFFGNPNTTVTSASFGQITGLYSGSASRNVQLAARVSF
ncbi:MAG: TonB-dependent receptor [Bryobacteraceae bacterium]